MADLSIWMFAFLALAVASSASASPASASASASGSASAVPDSEAAERLLVEAILTRKQEVLGWIRKAIDPSYEVKDEVPLAQLLRIMQDSSAVVGRVLSGLNQNFQTYFVRLYDQQLSAFKPHLKEFYNAIPAENFKRMWLQILRTAQHLTKNQCGIFELTHNPLHPLNSLDDYNNNNTTFGISEKLDQNREKFEADISASDTSAATLRQLGHAIALWMANVDDGIAESIANASAKWCLVLDQVLIWTIAKLENAKPEDVKGKWE